MSPYQRFILETQCPKCKRGNGHWCRENGKAIPPHRERLKAALGAAVAVLGGAK